MNRLIIWCCLGLAFASRTFDLVAHSCSVPWFVTAFEAAMSLVAAFLLWRMLRAGDREIDGLRGFKLQREAEDLHRDASNFERGMRNRDNLHP